MNHLIRFVLEVVALIVAGIWAWHQSNSIMGYVWGIALPIVMATMWGVFAVPNDPSRSGKTVIKTPGFVRLLLELGFFGFAFWAMLSLEWEVGGCIFGASVLLHYVLSYNRIQWLLKN